MSQNSPKVASITTDLTMDRVMILGSFFVTLCSIVLLVYITFNRGRIDVVYLSEDKFDSPQILDKISKTNDVLRADRYIKGMVRRFISNWWITPNMSKDEAKDALKWAVVHTLGGGHNRSKALLKDFENYEMARQAKWTAFKPLIDDDSVTIKQSAVKSDRYLVTVPGTFVSKTKDGESYLSGVLRLLILRTGVSGLPDSDAGDLVNATGLSIESATISLLNGSDSPTVIELF
jgi:hypothetical protein